MYFGEPGSGELGMRAQHYFDDNEKCDLANLLYLAIMEEIPVSVMEEVGGISGFSCDDDGDGGG